MTAAIFTKHEALAAEKLELAVRRIVDEYLRARRKFPGMNSAHEGYGVLKEEVDELWEDVKGNRIVAAKAEAVQVGAMALAFILEVPEPEVQYVVEIKP